MWVFILATIGDQILAMLPIKPNSWLELLLVVLRAISRSDHRAPRR